MVKIKVTTPNIKKHPAFAALRKAYNWDDKAKCFPEKLKNGKPNPLFGVVMFTTVSFK